jgi:hypothetical protein
MPPTSSCDADEQLGQPVISNGVPLTKTHHAAFDAHLLTSRCESNNRRALAPSRALNTELSKIANHLDGVITHIRVILNDQNQFRSTQRKLLTDLSIIGYVFRTTDHAIRIDAVHRLVGQHASLADRGAEEGGFAVVADAGGGEVLICRLGRSRLSSNIFTRGSPKVPRVPPLSRNQVRT